MKLFDGPRLRARADAYAARKDTPEWEDEQAREIAKTARYCTRLGYPYARGLAAARAYLSASRDTRTGPDWPGFRRAIRRAGLADTPPES